MYGHLHPPTYVHDTKTKRTGDDGQSINKFPENVPTSSSLQVKFFGGHLPRDGNAHHLWWPRLDHLHSIGLCWARWKRSDCGWPKDDLCRESLPSITQRSIYSPKTASACTTYSTGLRDPPKIAPRSNSLSWGIPFLFRFVAIMCRKKKTQQNLSLFDSSVGLYAMADFICSNSVTHL